MTSRDSLDHLSPAAEAFAEFLGRREEEPELDFDAFAAERPEVEAKLRRLHTDWLALQQVLGGPSPDSARRRTLPPGIGKTQHGPVGDGGQPSDAELLEQLTDQDDDGPRYALVDEIARGGMGAILRVWDRNLRRHLAMKVLLDTAANEPADSDPRSDPRSLSRFLEEAQVTGQLEHPGIVPVHELGLDATGRVYFTMPLIRGSTLSEVFKRVWDERDGWNLPRALGVIVRVCEAVAYAHHKGVIHRDLKPANIMVGAFGEAFVMDWGLSRVLGREDRRDLRIRPDAPTVTAEIKSSRQDDAEATPDSPLVTMDGDVVGTPVYMPPEQARGELAGVGPHSDVYSIGAMLYHLLARELPFASSARVSPYVVLARVLDGPPRPLHRSHQDIPAELQAICEKAMAREPEDRYADMRALGDDLRSYLEMRVVRAYRTGALVELKKWVARNKALASTAAAALVAVLLLSGWALVERDVAQHRAEELQQVADFQAGQLSGIDAEAMGLTVRAMVLERARAAGERAGREPEELEAERAELEQLLAGADFTGLALGVLDRHVFEGALQELESFANQPLVQARLLQTVATTLIELGLLDQALGPQQQALEIRRRELDNVHPDVLGSINDLGLLLEKHGKLGQAEPLLREALEGRRRTLGDEDRDTLTSLNNMGVMFLRQHKFDEAEPYLREALEGHRGTLGNEDRDTLTSINNMGLLRKGQNKLDNAESLLREALEGRRRTLGNEHRNTLGSINNLATLLSAQRRFDEAEPLLREALEGHRRTLGDAHLSTLTCINNLGSLFQRQNRLAEAESYLREALVGLRSTRGNLHSITLISVNNLGVLLKNQRKLDQAEPYLREALEGLRRALTDQHPYTLNSILNLANLLKDQRRFEEAEGLYRELVEHTPADHPKYARNKKLLDDIVAARQPGAGKKEQGR